MGLIGLLWFVASLASLVGFVWLCVIAFKRHVGWGLAVLFLSPFAAVFFAAKHWHESKKPFLIYMGSSAVMAALFVAAFSAMGGFQLLQAAGRASRGETLGDEAPLQLIQDLPQRQDDPGVLSADEEAELQRVHAMYRDTRQQGTPSGTDTIRLGSSTPGTGSGGPADRPPAEAATRTPTPAESTRQPAQVTADGQPVPLGYRRVAVGEAAQYVGHAVRITRKNGNRQRGTLADAHGNMLYVERHLSSGTITYELPASEVDSLLVAYR